MYWNQVAFYFNLIATGNEHIILFWNYENLKLVGVIYLEHIEIWNLLFLEPFPLLLVFDVYSNIYVYEIIFSYNVIPYKLIAQIEFKE